MSEDQIRDKSEVMEKIIKKFDEILEEEQTREQKNIILTKLLWFFGIQIFVLFAFLLINGNVLFGLKINVDIEVLKIIV